MSGGFSNKGPKGGNQLTSNEVLWVQSGNAGIVLLPETTAPSATSGVGKLYVKSSDHLLYYKDGSGTEIQLGSGSGGTGDVVGPSSATDNAFARFDTTTGKLIQNSLVTADDAGTVNIPTGQTYNINGAAHTHTFASLTSKPTTLSGYGITDAQATLNGTGFVKATGTTISYDNSTYLTTASAASTYQPLDSDLTTIAGLTATTDNFMVSVASAWASRTPAQVRTTLGLVVGTNVQAWDADLDTIAGLTATTDNFIVSVSSAWASRTPAQVKTTLSLNNVENTALSTWAGSTSITTLGTIATGTWSGTTIAINKGGSGQTTANAALNAFLPSQTSAARQYLRSDGTNTSWAFAHGLLTTYNIAASDSSTEDKAAADFVCTGSADQTQINTYITALIAAKGGTIRLAAGTYTLSATIAITGDGSSNSPTISIIGAGNRNTIITPASNVHAFTITGAIQVNIWDMQMTLSGSGEGIHATTNASAPYWAFWQSSFKNIFFKGNFTTHSGWAINAENPFRSTFENMEGQGIGNGIYLKTSSTSQNYNPGNCTFLRCFMDLNSTAGNGVAYKIHTVDDATSGSIMNIFTFIHCEAIDSASASTTSIGWYLKGNGLLYPTTKDITIINSNIEQFNTCVKLDHATENHVHLSYADTKDNGIIFDITSDSTKNECFCDSGYVGVSKTTKFLNDANTSATSPNIVGGYTSYIDTSGTLTNTKTSATILMKNAVTGPGTIPTDFSNFDLPANVIQRVRISSTAPSSGQVLTASSSTAASWQTPSGGSAGITRTITITSGSATMGASAAVDYVYLVAGAHTMTLPTAVSNTNRYTVKNNHSANITVNTTSSQTIDGTLTISVYPGDSVDIISNNTNWCII